MDLQLGNKRAVITGGSRGIGLAVARVLAAEGVAVALVGRDRVAAEAAAAEIAEHYGVTAIGAAGDTGEDESVRAMAQDVIDRLGPPDIVVNCAAEPAGQKAPPRAAEVTGAHLHRHMNVKVMGYLRVAQAFMPHMVDQGWGRIISISGMGARRPGDMVGGIRNIGVVAMSKNLAEDLAGTGVTTVVVHPGMTRTEKVDGMIADRARREGRDEAELWAQLGSRTLNGAIPTAEDIANLVAFLASPLSVAINGDVIAAAGGSRGVIEY